ncbi:radical SAM protein, TIGR01212 family [Peptoniphilus sp. oral taxon 375 str. F0436]|uniref:TIGR01212 family radical SAM protein n=1 Tax=Urinicoccus timonensis TaxID=2024205 RepID=UPI00021A22E5|nr:radical SAM protein, TIGR01212 family [Peptoniphilus sp. oral taxon 375 str. F0436]
MSLKDNSQLKKNKVPYRQYSEYLKDKYGQKVYKLPVKLNLTCPNRDGTCAYGGCIFCGEEGGSFENLEQLSVRDQLLANMDYIGKRYHANKFIAYFQNFTNTYQPLESYQRALEDCRLANIVGVNISTRPDFLGEEYLLATERICQGLDVCFELGLQSVNNHTLQVLNRGHYLSDFIEGVLRLKKYPFRIGVHLIMDLPWDDELDIIEAAKILNALKVDEIKLHSLYVLKNTVLERMLLNKEVTLLNKEAFQKRVILFLSHLDPDIVVQRIIGRAPKEASRFCNFGESWWKIRDEIIDQMNMQSIEQGSSIR